MTPTDLTAILLSRGLIQSPAATITPLAGGVSCDIYLIEDGATRFVLKRALPKLRVKDDWFADVNRNKHEQDYIDYVSAFLPGAVPRILHRAPELPGGGFFTMEYLGGEFANWKTLMLGGTHELWHAAEAGRILGTIHRTSWDDPVARERFATDKNFFDLRIESYILTTGRRHPALQPLFEAEAKRLAATKLCLVHGDYSPKNILVASRSAPTPLPPREGPGEGKAPNAPAPNPSANVSGERRMIVLDCEVAWFGDPVFDTAFLLNHLLLKMLLFRANPAPLRAMALSFWNTYQETLAPPRGQTLDRRTAHLLLMLMLARIDGKSPVEYLRDNDQKNLVRRFTAERLMGPPMTVAALIDDWSTTVDTR